ncbi:MAG: F0F1 ATP synthase subunit gamma [Patescibacteria group bacterium]
MPNTREIRGQIESVSKTRKITKTMELISMAKVRKASQKASESKDYSNEMKKIGDLVLSKITDNSIHPLLQKNSSKKTLAIILSTDRGLCGGLNTSLFSYFLHWAQGKKDLSVITIGKKGKEFAIRSGLDSVAGFNAFSKEINLGDIFPISSIVSEKYLANEFGEVYLFYMSFVNLAVQKSVGIRILPLERSEIDIDIHKDSDLDFIFEPSVRSIVDYLVPKLFEFQIFRASMESFASEQASRMIAMKNASDNAKDMIDDLTLNFNKARQGQITKEIAEIVSGSTS